MARDNHLKVHLRSLPGDAADAGSATVSLLAALASHDPGTASHTRGVVALALRVADRLGLTGSDREDLEHVARLHDIGKLAIPRRILLHRGPLDAADWELVRGHPAAGAAIVAQIPSLAHLAPLVVACHERWAGDGYPAGLRGEEIPMVSRLAFVCDAYDAMRSRRPYRSALSTAAAAMEIARGSATQFCPRSAAALLDVIAPLVDSHPDSAVAHALA